MNNMIFYNFDYNKQTSYISDFLERNFENYLDIVKLIIGIKGNYINKSYKYNDIDNGQQIFIL